MHIVRTQPSLFPALDAAQDGGGGHLRGAAARGGVTRPPAALTTISGCHPYLAHERAQQLELLRLHEDTERGGQAEERGVLAQHLCADGVERAQVHALEARAEHLHARLEHLGGVLREGDDKD